MVVKEKEEKRKFKNIPVLVLNKNWLPVGVTNLKRALKLVSTEYECGTPKARIIECDDKTFEPLTWDDWSKLSPKGEGVQTVDLVLRVPEVIVLSKYSGTGGKTKVTFSRRMLFRRDNDQCQYCGCKPGTSELSIDHVMPKSRGGETTWENCVASCVDCNSKKANRTPEQAGMRLRKKPGKPKSNLAKRDYKCESWEQFLGVAYWETEIENDNQD